MIKPIVLATALAAAAISTAANARDWPRTAGWDVFEFEDDCAIHSSFEGKGETELSLFLELNGDALLIAANRSWSIEEGEKADLTFVVNGSSYAGAASVGISRQYDSKKGFGAKFPTGFLADFAAAPSLVILKGDVVVDRSSLSGSGAALSVARRCLSKVRSDIASAAAEKRKYADIADDPFAKPTPGGPVGNPGSWFTDSDYPADARRASAQGRVSVQVDVDASGKVVGCRVTGSSGNASLDDATCRLAQRRGRFTIQKDSKGNAQPYSYQLPGIQWSL